MKARTIAIIFCIFLFAHGYIQSAEAIRKCIDLSNSFKNVRKNIKDFREKHKKHLKSPSHPISKILTRSNKETFTFSISCKTLIKKAIFQLIMQNIADTIMPANKNSQKNPIHPDAFLSLDPGDFIEVYMKEDAFILWDTDEFRKTYLLFGELPNSENLPKNQKQPTYLSFGFRKESVKK